MAVLTISDIFDDSQTGFSPKTVRPWRSMNRAPRKSSALQLGVSTVLQFRLALILESLVEFQVSNRDFFELIVGTVFAYGQTNSGKTYTMRGSASEPGVIPIAVRNLFDMIHQVCGVF